MSTGRPKTPIILSEEEQKQLESITSSRSLPFGLVTLARIVLMAVQGSSNRLIAEKIGLSPQSVCKWRQRFIQQGFEGLYDEMRAGRPRSISDEQVAELIRKTLDTSPVRDYAGLLRPDLEPG
ncbi:MAG: hypothetical protein BA865_07110 [Desulfobacterales bacterium S5133MH4]|jgi:putative transposase|nr:MAG: hypothetical protein BA865_07110 [Desulfobacterales bacterium S5133MH4]